MPPTIPPPPATGEDFAAVVVALYLTQFFFQLRQTAWAITVAAPLGLLAAASYPFEPERPLVAAFAGVCGVAVVAMLSVLLDVNRNELVSRIVRTAPGRLTPDRGFFETLLKFVGPLLLAVVFQAFGLFRELFDPQLGISR